MLVYAAIQYVAESAWCYVGLRSLRGPAEKRLLPSALIYGLVRLLIGRTVAFLIEATVQGVSEWIIYFFLLLPLRWLAWSLIADLIAAGRIRLRMVLAGDRPSNLWRLRGTLLSCLTDLPAFLTGMGVIEFWP